MRSRTQQTEMRRWRLGFLLALVAALAAILLGTTTSASASVGAETRVGAFNVAGEVLVGPPEHITAGQRLGNEPVRVVGVVATGVAANAVPKAGTLSNVEARAWYHAQLDAIPGRIDASLPLRDRALQAFTLRNEIKMQARGLMTDRAGAAALPPPRTLDDVVRRAYESGARGDDVWRYVLRGSGTSNPEVDRLLGLG